METTKFKPIHLYINLTTESQVTPVPFIITRGEVFSVVGAAKGCPVATS